MSNLSVNTITDASGGSTASINGLTPQASNMAGTNLLINGNFSISQRGTSFSHNNSINYSLDRWAVFSNGVSVNTQESFTVGQTDVPNEPKHYLKWTISSFSAGDNLFQRIEGVRNGAGQTLTLSFWAKADSAIANTPRLVQNFGSGGSAEVATTLSAINLTTAWQQFVITVTLPSISGKTIGSSDYLELELLRPDTFTGSLYVSQVQLEAGSTASSFAHEFVGDTLSKCMRYCQVRIGSEGSNGSLSQIGYGNARSTTSAAFQDRLQVKMRTAPSLTVINPTNFYLYQTSSFATTAISFDISDVNTMLLTAGVASGLTVPTFYTLGTFNAAAQLIYSAEL